VHDSGITGACPMRVSNVLRHVGSRRAFTSAGLISVPIGTRRLQSHSGNVTAAKTKPRAAVSSRRGAFILTSISALRDTNWACSAGEKISKRSSREQTYMDMSLNARRRSRTPLGIFSSVKVGESSMYRTCKTPVLLGGKMSVTVRDHTGQDRQRT